MELLAAGEAVVILVLIVTIVLLSRVTVSQRDATRAWAVAQGGTIIPRAIYQTKSKADNSCGTFIQGRDLAVVPVIVFLDPNRE